jgi:hypothetical protein
MSHLIDAFTKFRMPDNLVAKTLERLEQVTESNHERVDAPRRDPMFEGWPRMLWAELRAMSMKRARANVHEFGALSLSTSGGVASGL